MYLVTGNDLPKVERTLDQVRQSRQRIVEAGLEARRRIERDLHDGAQQQLVSLGMRLRLAAKSVARFVVWASHEVEDYARAFGLPKEKLEYVPFHTTLHDYAYEVRDDGYLFAGGNFDRDYRTLIEAVRDLPLPVWIATTRPEQLAGVSLPPWLTTGYRAALLSSDPAIHGLLDSAPRLFGIPLLIHVPAFAIVMLITWLLLRGARESATANNVIASANRLIDVRHVCLRRRRMADISVPAWPMPIHQTKFVMSKAHATGMLLPQMPMPLTTR